MRRLQAAAGRLRGRILGCLARRPSAARSRGPPGPPEPEDAVSDGSLEEELRNQDITVDVADSDAGAGDLVESSRTLVSAMLSHGIDVSAGRSPAAASREPLTPKSKHTSCSSASKHSLAPSLASKTKSLRDFVRRKTGPRKPSFHGHWSCTATWGLDAFLKDAGVSKMQRMAAGRAPWPSWEIDQSGDSFSFTNHSFLGDLYETFQVGGPEYKTIDGRRQEITCRAYWEGASLVIDKSGPQGRFQEIRRIDPDGMLQFTLQDPDQGTQSSWGRTFKKG